MGVPVNHTDNKPKTEKTKWCLKNGIQYLSSVRVENKGGNAAMSTCMTTEKDNALQLCTKAAAMSILCALEHHVESGLAVYNY